MPRQIVGRRLFQADGYTFVRHLDPVEFEAMLTDDEIQPCLDWRTGKQIGFKLKTPERVSSFASLVPFGRVYDKLLQPPSVNYPVPAYGDHRLRWMNRFIDTAPRECAI
jgi:hypothetical protein